MSGYFIYEIDEQKLKTKLKDLEVPPSSQAWEKFESYYSSSFRKHSEGMFNKIQIPVNKNTIIQIALGGVIVFFSVVLLNFLDIKNPETKDSTVEEIIDTISPSPNFTVAEKPVRKSNTKTIQVIAIPANSISKNLDTVGVKKAEPIAKTIIDSANPIHIAADSKTFPVNENTLSAVATTNVASSPGVEATPTKSIAKSDSTPSKTSPITKPAKRKKREATDIGAPDNSTESRPVTEGGEREGAVKPN